MGMNDPHEPLFGKCGRWLGTLLMGVGLVLFGGVLVLRRGDREERAPRAPYAACLAAPCPKCGGREIRLSYCLERCTTMYPLIEGRERRAGGPVVWGYEHLHRACRTCGFEGEATECLNVNEGPTVKARER